MGTYYHQLSHLESSVDSEEKNFQFVLSWEMDDAEVEVKIHQGPRMYAYLFHVDISSCELFFLQKEKLIRWKPQIIQKNGKYYLEIQEELEKHGLKYKPWTKELFEWNKRCKSIVYCESMKGNIGKYGFYDAPYSWNDWSRCMVNAYFLEESQIFGKKQINSIESHYACGDDTRKTDAAQKMIEKCNLSKEEVKEFLTAFDDVEYDFHMLMRGNDWKIYASDRQGLVINDKEVAAPKDARKDAFAWMISYIMEYLYED